MKRFIAKIIFFSIPVFLILCICEISARKIPNEYSFKHSYLENNIDKIEILSLGSSVGRSGINPMEFESETFNAGNVSQSLDIDIELFNKYINRASNLNTIILPLIPNSYWSKLEESIEHWRLRKYNLYMNIPIHTLNPEYNLEIYNLKSTFQYLIDYYIKNKNILECDNKGMGLDSISDMDFKESGMFAANLHNCNMDNTIEQELNTNLEKIFKTCLDKNIDVYLILMPCFHTYYDLINSNQLNRMDSISNSWALKYPNIYYYNLLKDNRFVQEDFRNANHLSIKGASKLSKYINNIIIENKSNIQ